MPSPRNYILRTTTAVLYAHVSEVVASCKAYGSIMEDELYILNILPSFLIAFFTWGLLEKFDSFLDKRYNWTNAPGKRLTLQLLGSSMGACVLMLAVVFSICFFINGPESYRSDWLAMQGKVVFTFVVFTNLMLVTVSLYRKLKETEDQLDREFPYRSQL